MVEFHQAYNKKELLLKPISIGIIGSLTLLGIYVTLLSLVNSFEHAISQFKEMWLLMSLLIIGFGIQIGLFTYVRSIARMQTTTLSASTVATTGGISGTAMVACCAHHITDIIPLLGLSAATLFISKFQTLFLVIGIVSNILGINLMLKIIQEKKLYIKNTNIMGNIMKINMKNTLYIIALGGSLAIIATMLQSI